MIETGGLGDFTRGFTTLFTNCRLTSTQQADAGGVEQQFGPDPATHATVATHPRRQRAESAAEADRIAEVAFDLLAVLHQLRPEAAEA